MLGFIIFLCYIASFIPIIKVAIRASNLPWIEVNWKRPILYTVLVAVTLTIILVLLRVYTEVLWFNKFGFTQRYWKVIYTSWCLFGLFGIVAFGFMRWNLKPISSIIAGGKLIHTWLPIIIGIVFGLIASTKWHTTLLYTNKILSGVVDPIFGKDVSFYLFSLPFWVFVSS